MPSNKDRSSYFDGRKALKSEYDKAYRLRPEVRIRERNDQLAKYGMTHADYEDLLAKQNGACAVCKSTTPNTDRIKNFPIDHCHVTGKVRGLLCSRCNRAIGLLQDKVELLEAAVEYLKANG